ncbi:hypothetical protein CYLTODRAFT_338506, partial [Cylindrobasidium torrendii FP15055 ss-10]
HGGTMAQIGLSMGARHKPQLDYGKSFLKPSTPDDERERQDIELIGALSIFWAMLHANMPTEIMADVTARINDTLLPYPPMATAHVKPGAGYTIHLGGTEYTFPLANRCPPEGYATVGY